MLIIALLEIVVVNALDCHACFANVARGQSCAIGNGTTVVTCPSDDMACYYETVVSVVDTWETPSEVAWRGCRPLEARTSPCQMRTGVVGDNAIVTESCLWMCNDDRCTAENVIQLSTTSNVIATTTASSSTTQPFKNTTDQVKIHRSSTEDQTTTITTLAVFLTFNTICLAGLALHYKNKINKIGDICFR